jgi:hypothetical protein
METIIRSKLSLIPNITHIIQEVDSIIHTDQGYVDQYSSLCTVQIMLDVQRRLPPLELTTLPVAFVSFIK